MFVFLFLSCQVLSTKVFLPQSNPGQGQEQTQETEDKKEREGEGNKKKKKGAGKILWEERRNYVKNYPRIEEETDVAHGQLVYKGKM